VVLSNAHIGFKRTLPYILQGQNGNFWQNFLNKKLSYCRRTTWYICQYRNLATTKQNHMNLLRFCCRCVSVPCDCDLWPFDVGQWSFSAEHVIISQTEFEDSTSIHSW